MQRKKPSFRQIEYFVAIAESSSFRKAAERIGVSQPTITAQISALETALDLKLFERLRGGAQLSAAGRELLPNARRVLEEADGFIDSAEALCDRPGGTYRLGVTPTLGPYALPHILPELHRRYPNLRFHLREDSPTGLEDGLAEGRHDLILGPMPITDDDFFVAPLFREPVRLVVSADDPLADKEPLLARDLRGTGILVMEEHHRFSAQVEQLCQRLGARLQRDYYGTSLDALRHMVVMGLGHAFLPALYTLSEIREESQLRVKDIQDESFFRLHALAWRKTSPSRAFFQRVAGEIREIVRSQLASVVIATD